MSNAQVFGARQFTPPGPMRIGSMAPRHIYIKATWLLFGSNLNVNSQGEGAGFGICGSGNVKGIVKSFRPRLR